MTDLHDDESDMRDRKRCRKFILCSLAAVAGAAYVVYERVGKVPWLEEVQLSLDQRASMGSAERRSSIGALPWHALVVVLHSGVGLVEIRQITGNFSG